jgi:O-methyltransferase involved in polyketide biosynthesis
VAIDDAARAGAAAQVVILGAGPGRRAWRLEVPGATFFEVDHPASAAGEARSRDET